MRAFLAAEMCVADETQINTQRERDSYITVEGFG